MTDVRLFIRLRLVCVPDWIPACQQPAWSWSRPTVAQTAVAASVHGSALKTLEGLLSDGSTGPCQPHVPRREGGPLVSPENRHGRVGLGLVCVLVCSEATTRRIPGTAPRVCVS